MHSVVLGWPFEYAYQYMVACEKAQKEKAEVLHLQELVGETTSEGSAFEMTAQHEVSEESWKVKEPLVFSGAVIREDFDLLIKNYLLLQ